MQQGAGQFFCWCSGECQRPKSDIYLSLSVGHSTSITKFSLRQLIELCFELNYIKLNRLILLNYLPQVYLLLWVFGPVASLEFMTLLGAPITAGTLQGVFQLFSGLVKATASEGVPIDCADGKIRRCFPILSGWIANHMEHVLLHGIKSNACPKCEVPTEDLGIPWMSQCTRDYTKYDHYQCQNKTHRTEIQQSRDTLETLGIKIGQTFFMGFPEFHH